MWQHLGVLFRSVELENMPRCVGLPNGECPGNRNDKSVTLGEGDQMLCQSCDKEQHMEYLLAKRQKTSLNNSPSTNSKLIRQISADDAFPPAKTSGWRSSRGCTTTTPSAHQRVVSDRASSGITTSEVKTNDKCRNNAGTADSETGLSIRFNELLMYVQYY